MRLVERHFSPRENTELWKKKLEEKYLVWTFFSLCSNEQKKKEVGTLVFAVKKGKNMKKIDLKHNFEENWFFKKKNL